jgi:tRNA threonylcarbamoyl adenosine modification protein YeaZ
VHVVLVVVVDTSTPAVTAALALVDPHAVGGKGVEILSERRTVDGRAHGELLGPAVAAVLAETGTAGRDLAAVVAGLGPGPFTGLRVGLMTAAALSQALAVPAYGVCSLDAIGALTADTVLVATDARRKEVYWAVYRDGVRLTEPSVNRPDALAALLDGSGVRHAVGDGARLYEALMPVPLLDEPRYPSAAALAGLAADRIRGRAPGEPLTPLYLRRPDASEPHAPKAVTP